MGHFLSNGSSGSVTVNSTTFTTGWSSGTTYASGAVVVYGDGIYKSLSSNTGNTPTAKSIIVSIGPATTATLSDASSFPSSGSFRAEGVVYTYTGKSTNTLTGISPNLRGQLVGSYAVSAYWEKVSGDKTYIKVPDNFSFSSSATGSMSTTLFDCGIYKNKTHVYLLGGHTGSSNSNVIQRAVLNSDGTVGNFSNYGTLSSASRGNAYWVCVNKIYGVVSGTQNIQSATINADGTIGSWTTTNSALPTTLYAPVVYVTGTYVYLLGDGTYMHRASFDVSSGALGTFSSVSIGLSDVNFNGSTYQTCCASFKHGSYLYLVGGNTGGTIQRSKIIGDDVLSSFSTLSTTTSNTFGVGSCFVVSDSGVFIYGESMNQEMSEFIPFLPGGEIGTPRKFTKGYPRQGATSFVHNGYTYIVGGLNVFTPQATTFVSGTKNAISNDQTYENQLYPSIVSVEKESHLGVVTPFEKFGSLMLYRTR
jgi:hypothetical protein